MPTPCRRLLILAALAAVLLASWPPTARAQDAAAGQGGAVKVDANESFLHWMARASGKLGWLLLAMSFYLIALVAWMSFEYRRSVAIPPKLVTDLTEMLAAKQYTEAFNRASADPSFLARVVAAGVRKLPAGLTTAQRAMELANDDVTMGMEHRTTYLATVGTLGPMIGLVGTVYGMIESFRVIATAGASPQASQLAGGISTALFATLEGIALSIPAIYFFAVFRNRIARLSLEVALAAETLLEGFAPGVRAPHPLASAAVAQRSISGPNS
jgi:biopolymer transport protein ExbB